MVGIQIYNYFFLSLQILFKDDNLLSLDLSGNVNADPLAPQPGAKRRNPEEEPSSLAQVYPTNGASSILRREPAPLKATECRNAVQAPTVLWNLYHIG